MHDLNEKLKYLGEELINNMSIEGTTDDDDYLESGHWCIIKAHEADEKIN